MDIEDFIDVRLTEDEQMAHASVRWEDGVGDWAASGDPDWEHIARHNPNRVLRRCAAIRALIRDLGSLAVNIGTPSAELDSMLAPVAAIWSDHADYNPEWKSL
jgi:hypothetical protein